MKYKELIQFNPIQSVLELVKATENENAANLVSTFVFSKDIELGLREIIAKNLSTNPIDSLSGKPYETKGIQVVGSYGTGKTHLMSLISVLAENANLLSYLKNESLRKDCESFAGKYKVLRFEPGNDHSLHEIVFFQIERFLHTIGINYKFNPASPESWKVQLQQMMAVFEQHFPNHHFLLVIDEMLEYLALRNTTNELGSDLSFLRQVGEVCDQSRFKIIFGIQELLYRAPDFQYVAQMLNRVAERYVDLIITKKDVSFVVKERLLKKDEHQKRHIREHLLKFSHLFDGLNNDLNEYVDLFPVHPAYIVNFSNIKHGRSQREILKVLTEKFLQLMDNEVPPNEPGLVTYDSYWSDLSSLAAMQAVPDIRLIADNMQVIQDRIASHFTGARASRKQLAESIAKALAIRVLSDSLDKKNGATAESLKNDLCVMVPNVNDNELLLNLVENAATQLVTATAGQYVEKDMNTGQYFIRTEGGINVVQVIKDYAEQVIKRNNNTADEYFFNFLQINLQLQTNTYRSGFKIWQHSLEWLDKKSYRAGYIFFGNPNERSTTEPIQQYYLFFTPLFGEIQRNNASDEVYFDMSDLSAEFKDLINYYGAAFAKYNSAQSNEKQLYKKEVDDSLQKLHFLFNREYAEKVTVWFKGESRPLRSFPLPGEGYTRELIFSAVAAKLLNTSFNDTFPDYPAFTDLAQPVTDSNLDSLIKSAFRKITKPSDSNRNGEAILAGLGLWTGQTITSANSKYANWVLQKLEQLPQGAVVNRTDLLYAHHIPSNSWFTHEHQLDYPFFFVVLATLAYKGDIEIVWSPQKTLSATNLELLNLLSFEDMFTFQHIKKPQGIPYRDIKALFTCLQLPDYTSELEKPETITYIITEAKKRVEKVVRAKSLLSNGIYCRSIPLLDQADSQKMQQELANLATLLDTIQSYNTYGKLKAFRLKEEVLMESFQAYAYVDFVHKLTDKAYRLDKLISYLISAQSYVVQEEKPLYDDMEKAKKSLAEIITSANDVEIRKYETLVNSLIDRYATYYVNQYTRCRLSSRDALKKEALLSSNKKRICDSLKEAEFLSTTEYTNWLNNITALRAADESLNRDKVKQEPYHDFNPREFYGKPTYTIQVLEEQLSDIVEKWTSSLRSVFKDPSVNDAMDILSDGDKQLVSDFVSGAVSLTPENAPALRRLNMQLSQGIEKIELHTDELRKRIHKPLTPQEMIDALSEYVESLCQGKERNKLRILIK